jgi:predicted NBD/HSP70 family sugar kinase
VRAGIVETASHIDPVWIGIDAVEFFSRVTGRPAAVLNDADAAGLAEVRQRDEVSWDKYAGRLQAFLGLVQRVLWPELIIIGGGISNVADQFLPMIELRTPIVPAQLRNHAGIIGAALLAPQG